MKPKLIGIAAVLDDIMDRFKPRILGEKEAQQLTPAGSTDEPQTQKQMSIATTAVSAHIKISAKRNVEITEDQWDDLAEALEMSDFDRAIQNELDASLRNLIDIDITFGG